jgi:hypothetical protein
MKMPSVPSSAAAASRSAADPAMELGHGEFLPPNLVALRSSAFPDCPSDALHTLIQTLGILKDPALSLVPDDRLAQAMYQLVLRVRTLVPLYSRLSATEFATMPASCQKFWAAG